MQLEREVPQLVEYFNRACDWLRAHNLPVPKIDLMHLFGMELMSTKDYIKMGGFHHDYLGQLEKSGIIRLEVTKRLSSGFYEAKIWVGSTIIHPSKTFFPREWKREQVLKYIANTYRDCVNQKISPVLQVDGKYLLVKQIGTKTELCFHLDQKMNIKSVYPRESKKL